MTRHTLLALAGAALFAAAGGCKSGAGESQDPEGVWGKEQEEARGADEDAGAPDPEQKEQLEALGYLATTDDPDDRAGLITYDSERAADGVNLFLAASDQEAWLVDMDGTRLHRWWLGINFAHVELDGAGELLAIRKNRRLYKLDERSRVLWSSASRAHHDVSPAGRGYIVLSREIRRVATPSGELPILADTLVWLDKDGIKQREVPLLGLFFDAIPKERFERIREHWERTAARHESPVPEAAHGLLDRKIMYGTAYDVFHTNSVEVIERRVRGVARRGDVLVSIREIDTVAIIDPRRPAVRWQWGPGEIEAQHHATLVGGGHILLFDNGVRRRRSRVVELDPRKNEIVWEYQGEEGEEFFSAKRSSAQRLPGGNTLIALGDRGRLLEVTPEGEVVWEYWLPKAGEGKRQATYRVERIQGKHARELRRRFGARD